MSGNLPIKCGDWSIDLSNPWPMWVTISFKGNEIEFPGAGTGPTHKDLRDLAYAIERAMICARGCLGKDGDEV